MVDEKINIIKFSEVISALIDIDHPFPPRFLREFSDLSRREISELTSVWSDLPIVRKQSLLEDLDEINESDMLVNFNDLALSIISDPEPIVRILAIRLLWECEDAKIAPMMTDLMLDDPDEAVRATSASILGKFVYLGELDAISDNIKIPLFKNLLEVAAGDDLTQVRRRALESLGYSSSPKVAKLIQTAYESKDIQWMTSALCTMGRSADERWADTILKELNSSDSEIVFEAVRAAGELELKPAVEQLLFLLNDEAIDPETRYAIIWSLSQIGGDESKQELEKLLENAQDDEELDWTEKAIENLEVSGSSEALELIDFDSGNDFDPLEIDSEEDD
jgi:HEAT repeat protein